MNPGERYRLLAADCDARARQEPDIFLRQEWTNLAASYRRLAHQADRNAQTDVTYEPSPGRRPDTSQAQQQQQSQPKTKPGAG